MFFDVDTIACSKLRCDALEILQAGLDAVSPRSLFLEKVRFDGGVLSISDFSLPINITSPNIIYSFQLLAIFNIAFLSFLL